MHEYSIARALLDTVEKEARARGAKRVRRLRVKIGELSGVEADLLAAAYEVCRDGSICAGADLEIRTVETRWECPQCRRALPEGGILTCAACGTAARLAQGDEILLQTIEMEVP